MQPATLSPLVRKEYDPPRNKQAAARVFDMDDVVGHLLGFVKDRQKVGVLSLVNKTCARMSQDPASWKYGSDGYIVSHRPTKKRLRLLRTIHSPCHIPGTVWMTYCPALVSFQPFHDISNDACDALAKRLEVYHMWERTPLMNALEAARAPQLHTLLVCGSDVDLDAFPALTSLTVGMAYGDATALSTKMHKLTRLNLGIADLQRLVVDAPTPWNLREITLNMLGIRLEVSLVVSMGALCPHLVSLTSNCDATWTCEEVRDIAMATPLLERLQCDRIDFDSEYRYPIAANMWPHLESLTVEDDAAFVMRHLANPHLLRHVHTKRTFTQHDVRLMSALIDLAPPLTSLRMGFDVDPFSAALASAELMPAVLTAVGATLERLAADVDFVLVGRYCPRLRNFQRRRVVFSRDWAPLEMAHMTRGCPLIEPFPV
jgi:hypothetical protein